MRFAKFWFQTGSIKSAISWQNGPLGKMFWFQTGSIKRPKRIPKIGVKSQFWFQTGSIKRNIATWELPRAATAFDSRLVRLKERRWSCLGTREKVLIPDWFD